MEGIDVCPVCQEEFAKKWDDDADVKKTAFPHASTLPLPCAPTALAARTPPLPCVSTMPDDGFPPTRRDWSRLRGPSSRPCGCFQDGEGAWMLRDVQRIPPAAVRISLPLGPSVETPVESPVESPVISLTAPAHASALRDVHGCGRVISPTTSSCNLLRQPPHTRIQQQPAPSNSTTTCIILTCAARFASQSKWGGRILHVGCAAVATATSAQLPVEAAGLESAGAAAAGGEGGEGGGLSFPPALVESGVAAEGVAEPVVSSATPRLVSSASMTSEEGGPADGGAVAAAMDAAGDLVPAEVAAVEELAGGGQKRAKRARRY